MARTDWVSSEAKLKEKNSQERVTLTGGCSGMKIWSWKKEGSSFSSKTKKGREGVSKKSRERFESLPF
jgi:hypothetical protein